MPEQVAIMSDVHGNSPALRAVLEDIRGAGCTRVFFLGDLVNGVDPGGCVELLRGWGDVTCLKGNAEHYTLTPDLDTLPHREEPAQAALVKLIQWFRSRLRATDITWLHSLPDLLLWSGSGFVHDSPIDRVFPQQWHFPGIDEKYQEWFYHAKGITEDFTEGEWASLLAWMESQDVFRVFCGHTHVPFVHRVGTALVCNVGSVGLPLDGDPRSSWVLLEERAAGEYGVTLRRVAYDTREVLKLVDATPDYPDFESFGRKEAYKKMLVTGVYWSASA